METHLIQVLGDISPSKWEHYYPLDMTPTRFQAELEQAGGADLHIELHSAGGFAEEGFALYVQGKKYSSDGAKITFEVLGESASAASLWQMCADEILLHESGTVMIHNPWGFAHGGEEDFVAAAEQLRKMKRRVAAVYAARTGNTEEKIIELMNAETWMDGEEALEYGFADKLISNKKKADVNPSLSAYKNMPPRLSKEILELPETLEARERVVKSAKLHRFKLQLAKSKLDNIIEKDVDPKAMPPKKVLTKKTKPA